MEEEEEIRQLLNLSQQMIKMIGYEPKAQAVLESYIDRAFEQLETLIESEQIL